MSTPRRFSSIRTTLPLLLGLFLSLAFGAAAAAAQNIIVDSTGDTIANDGVCTLREAVNAANTDKPLPNSVLGECPPGSGDDTIVFDASLAGATITLTSNDDTAFGPSALLVSSTITIDGSNAPGLAISQSGTRRLFYVNSSGNLTLQNITLSGGVARGFNGGRSRRGGAGGGGAGMGGAVFNEGTLSVLNSTLTGNTAQGGHGGGIFPPGANPLGGGGGGGTAGRGNDATHGGTGGAGGGGGGGGGQGGNGGFGGGGGGGSGKTTDPSGFNGGTGGVGGGGGGGGSCSSCPHSGTGGDGGAGGLGGGDGHYAAGNHGLNVPGGGGGGGGGLGGAIFNKEGIVILRNSTISGNTTAGGGSGSDGFLGMGLGGGIFNFDGTLTSQNVTINENTADQGGGIYNHGDGATATATINNTIIANSNTATNDFVADGMSSTSGAGNLIESQSGFSGTIVSTSDPKLAALAANGGPTQTHDLQADSPARDKGDNTKIPSGQLFDQRGPGFPRIYATTVDIGALEYSTPANLIVVKSNSGTPALVGQPWQWRLQVSNTGSTTATFAKDDVLLVDHLPTSLTYDATVTVDNQTGITGTISCAINASNVLRCTASGGLVTVARATGSFRTVVTATAWTSGSFVNPTGGTCAVDPNDDITESDETDNACTSNTVVVQDAPELSVVKSNSGSPAAVGQPWQWHLQVSNLGTLDATFASGDKLLIDHLPTSDVNFPQGPPTVSYDATVTVDNQTGITGTISCSTAGPGLLICTADGGPVTVGKSSGSFRAVVTATASESGTFANPTGGPCAVDPEGKVSEGNETNNACNTDTVSVAYLPELSVVKSNSGTPAAVGQPWQWYLQVSTLGSVDAYFNSGDVLLIDHLPTTGVTYDATVTVDNQTSITGTISCAINAGVLQCTASGGPVTIGGDTGSFRVVVTATASATGSYTNPTGGTCVVDPHNIVPEPNETNNTCNTDTVEVQDAPELSVVKSNNGSPVLVGQSWQWRLQVSNTGTADASFASGEVLLIDHLPTTGVSYNATVSVKNQTALTGTISCAIDNATSVLTCTASGGPVTLGKSTGTFRAVITATASATGSYTNPTGGTCSVDPNGKVSESDETNNACNSDTVDVAATLPELSVVTSNSGAPMQVGQPWQWRFQVSNTGTAAATFASGEVLLIDHLPTSALPPEPGKALPSQPNTSPATTEISFDATVTVDNQTGITGTISCSITDSVLRCTATGGAVSVGATTGSFRVVVTATASATGTFANYAGPCAVDPDDTVSESNEGNNACNLNTVSVLASGPATRYVATTGSDTANTCLAQATPCATLSHAVNQANPGDTIFMATGSYSASSLMINKALTLDGPSALVH